MGQVSVIPRVVKDPKLWCKTLLSTYVKLLLVMSYLAVTNNRDMDLTELVRKFALF